MQIDSQNILGELERLGASCPWDEVDIWIKRSPPGKITFTAFVNRNETLGFNSVFGNGESVAEAVTDAVSQCSARDPESAKERKIEQLREQIAKLQSVVIGLPPYVPNRELSAGRIRVRETVDVSALPSVEQPAAA